MTFRTITHRLTLVAAIAALATSAAVQATPASAAPPDSGLGASGAGDGPVGPSGCRGDCGGFGDPKPYHRGVVHCADGKPDLGGLYCPPPASPSAPAPAPDPVKQEFQRYFDAEQQCDTGDAAGCNYIHTHSLPVLSGSSSGTGGGFIQMFPTKPDGAVDCAKTPEDANCDPDGHWCYDHPEDPNCAGVTGTWCDEHPDAAECNADQAQGLAAADNAAADQPADNVAADNGGVDNGADVAPDENAAPDQAADDVGAMDDGGMDAIDDGGGMADGGQ